MNLNKISFAIFFAIIFSNHLCYAAKGTTSADKPITASVCADRSFDSSHSNVDLGSILPGKTASGTFDVTLSGNQKVFLKMETGGAVLLHEDKKTELPYTLNVQVDKGFTFESDAKVSASGDIGDIARFGSGGALGYIAENSQPKLKFNIKSMVPKTGLEAGNYAANIQFTLMCI